MKVDLPEDWHDLLAHELHQPYFRELGDFVNEERRRHDVFPPPEDVVNAFKLTPFASVRVLLLGQDPYHGPGQAHGLCFSVRPGVRKPPSLVNIFKELNTDLGVPIAKDGNLDAWAKHGVMLLNAVLTVRANEPNSHKNQGWERFTDAVIQKLNEREKPVVFALWGGFAQKKEKLVTNDRHAVVKAAHPSPLSAKKFLGSRPFSAINAALEERGQDPIDWSA
ncbi:MAG: uracil-DNA glycosylase [Gemmataceae bacterium]|nr:uracil-DNA glycosylase [Gemmataceae bacterium]